MDELFSVGLFGCLDRERRCLSIVDEVVGKFLDSVGCEVIRGVFFLRGDQACIDDGK